MVCNMQAPHDWMMIIMMIMMMIIMTVLVDGDSVYNSQPDAFFFLMCHVVCFLKN